GPAPRGKLRRPRVSKNNRAMPGVGPQMLLPVVFALAVPASFARMVEARLATTSMHVADWWADDLDGDHAPESIAFVCDDDGGFFLVQQGSELLETPVWVDGRNSCPKPDARPA